MMVMAVVGVMRVGAVRDYKQHGWAVDERQRSGGEWVRWSCVARTVVFFST